jgi:TRAP transporter TAXI family solute receptor
MRELLKVYVPAILLIVIGFVIAFRFVAPPPPKELRIAGGVPDGFYHKLAERYRDALAAEDVKVIVIDTEGAVDNLRRLINQPDKVDVALVQGGLAADVPELKTEAGQDIVTIGGLFYEPVWVLVRNGVRATSLVNLKTRRIAIGSEGSGTQLLARQFLSANGVDERNSSFVGMTTADAMAALDRNDIDAAFVVTAEPTGAMSDLLSRRKARVLPFEQADAYKMKFPYLTAVKLPAGAVSLADNVPQADLALVAPTGMLVAREDLHPALLNLLLQVSHELQGGRQLFAAAGTFPSGAHLDFPLDSDAKRYYERGPSVLFRYLPFWIAVWTERMTVLIIPLLAILPILRVAPPAYRWQVQRKIFRWYRRLRHIEVEATTTKDSKRRAELQADIVDLEDRLSRLKVPASYAQQLYDLRLHVDFVRMRLASLGAVS